MSLDVEQSQAIANQAEKRQRAFDKTIDEWKRKVADLQGELENSQHESRGNAAEVYKLRSQVDESNESIEALRRENKNLSGEYFKIFCIKSTCNEVILIQLQVFIILVDEIHDLTDQLNDGGRNVHELEKSRKRLEMEKEELQSALEEAETALEQEEAKVMRATLEISSIRQDIILGEHLSNLIAC